MRCGVCLALTEIINSTSRETIVLHLNTVIPAVRYCPCPPSLLADQVLAAMLV
jgi:hypothetical protein